MEKYEQLKQKLSAYGRLAVAFSGGVDSTLLLHAAKSVLGDEVMAFLLDSPVLARRDARKAVDWLEETGVVYEVVIANPFDVPEFVANDRRRCYFCKRNYYNIILKLAKTKGFLTLADGQNADDALATDRPGAEAAHELGVVSPLLECGLTKEDIRRYSRELWLPVWNQPANACLATRIPFGTPVTEEGLSHVEMAEDILRRRGMEGCRVRCHGDLARIEVPREYFSTIVDTPEIVDAIKEVGFKYVTLDLEGFRSGSMN